MIRRLLYVSTILAPHLPSAVEDILRASVANNLRDGLTGFLICDGVHFIQALEGEPAAVEACLGRIAADDRHTALAVRLDGLSLYVVGGGLTALQNTVDQLNTALAKP